MRQMQRLNAATEAESQMTATATAPVTTRTVEEIQADYARERAEFDRLHRENEKYNEQRRVKMARRDKLESEWKRQNPGEPFDPEAYVPPAYIPDPNSPVQAEYHAKHYTLARLEQELAVARKRDTGLI